MFVREPMFQGQTKEKLNNPEMTAVVDNFVRPALEAWLNANMTAADQIVGRIVLAAKARLASREAAQEVKRKSATQRRLNLPGKLADCKSTDLDETELFIVEGDSAGGSAKQGRNNNTQAVLPLRGKILNSEGLALAKVLTNQELTDLVTAIGTGAGEKFNLDGLRYGKIILLMDADADGHHITTLLLAFFFRHMTGADPQGARLHRPAAAVPHRRRQGDATGPATTPTRKRSSPSLQAERQAGDHALQGPGRDDCQGRWPRRRSTRRSARCCRSTIDSNLEADKTFVELLGKDPASRYRFIMESANQVDTRGTRRIIVYSFSVRTSSRER